MDEREQQPIISPAPATTPPRRHTSGILAGVAAVFLVIALVIFVLQNTNPTRVEFLGWNLDVAQGISLLLAAVVGFVIAVLGRGVRRLRRGVRARR